MKTLRHSAAASAFILSLIATVLLFPASASAHAPKDVQLAYDTGTHILSVTITHSSPFPSLHYIKLVEMKKNGVSANSETYKDQPGNSPFTYTYTIQAAEGDTLQVTAFCSMFGSKTVEMKVQGKAAKK